MKYRKKPVVVDAIQWTGDNFNEVVYNFSGIISGLREDNKLDIQTLEGCMTANIGDYIVKGESSKQGIHFWPVKEDYFNEHYEKVEE